MPGILLQEFRESDNIGSCLCSLPKTRNVRAGRTRTPINRFRRFKSHQDLETPRILNESGDASTYDCCYTISLHGRKFYCLPRSTSLTKIPPSKNRPEGGKDNPLFPPLSYTSYRPNNTTHLILYHNHRS